MSVKIQIKRGLSTALSGATLLDGEMAYTSDDQKLYIGFGSNKVLLNPVPTALTVGLDKVTNESKTTMFANPTFTGVPVVPTATQGTNTTQIASTAFVNSAITTATTNMLTSSSTIDGGTF